jgi:hypothetical protein
MPLPCTAFACTIALAASIARLAGQLPALSTDGHLGFTFEKGGCELGLLMCHQTQPQEWATEELQEVKRSLDEIGEKSLGKLILARCQQRGFTRLRRYRFPAGPRSDAGTPSAALYRDRFVTSINIFDAFFRTRAQRDHFSGKPGYLLSAQILLHECFHAIDDLSGSPEFLSLVGFVTTGSSLRFSASTDSEISALTRFGAEIQKTPVADAGELWRVTRSFALQMRPVRVPSMQSLQSPAEAFADIGSHLVLDPRSRSYLRAEVVTWFEKHVLATQNSGR